MSIPKKESFARRRLAVALNGMEKGYAVVALNFELPTAGATPPTELMLIPPGARVEGRDGRAWNNPDPAGVVRFFQQRGLKIPIDLEHSTELKAPKGEAAPAMAWGTQLEAKADGSVWAKTSWNPRGTEMVVNREYSYYSPAIIFDQETMNIVGIKSVGLTNTPNFQVPALNREGGNLHDGGSPNMELEQLLASLGLPAGTTFAAALNCISKMKTNLVVATNAAQSPSLDKFVPKADYDLALNRAQTAEGQLTETKSQALEVAINTEIGAALAAGKITPGTKDYHVAQCRQEGGLERFKTFVSAAPVVAADSGLDGKDPNAQQTALNAEQEHVANLFGNSVDDLKKFGGLK